MRKFRSTRWDCWPLILLVTTSDATASIHILPGSISSTIAETFADDRVSGGAPRHPASQTLLQRETQFPGGTSFLHDFSAGLTAIYPAILYSGASSSFAYSNDLDWLDASASGFADSAILGADLNKWNLTSMSTFGLNLRLFIDSPTRIDWQYMAAGAAGDLGLSDGLSGQLKIDEFTDSSFSSLQFPITNLLVAAETGRFNTVLQPGYYEIVAGARTLFSSANVSNRDGSSGWQYSLHMNSAIPEASSASTWLLLLSAVLLMRPLPWTSRI